MRTIRAGAGRTIPAGSGVQQGPWQNFDVGDGLPASSVVAILQDGNGDLWFGGAMGGGVCRYDGTEFTVFSAADGLPGASVLAILEDRDGYLWFGMQGTGDAEDGVACRYDGDEYVVYTAEDGLVSGKVYAVTQDQNGDLWFGTNAGASRFDGREFVTYTTADGLGDDRVVCILEDRQGHLWFATDAGGAETPLFRSEGPVFQGDRATALEVKPSSFLGWNLTFVPQESIDPFGYFLRFVFHPGDATGPRRPQLNVFLNTSKPVKLIGGELEGVGVDLEAQEWQTVEIPLVADECWCRTGNLQSDRPADGDAGDRESGKPGRTRCVGMAGTMMAGSWPAACIYIGCARAMATDRNAEVGVDPMSIWGVASLHSP